MIILSINSIEAIVLLQILGVLIEDIGTVIRKILVCQLGIDERIVQVEGLVDNRNSNRKLELANRAIHIRTLLIGGRLHLRDIKRQAVLVNVMVASLVHDPLNDKTYLESQVVTLIGELKIVALLGLKVGHGVATHLILLLLITTIVVDMNKGIDGLRNNRRNRGIAL